MPDASHPGSRRRTVVTALLLVLALWLVAALVAAGYVGYRLAATGTGPFSDPGLSDASARSEATSVAEQFTLRMDNVDAEDFDGYVEGVNEMLTTKAKAENKESLEVMKQTYEAAEVKGKGEVLVTGVSEISDDEATVVVAHDAEVTTARGDIQHHYRWSVDLVKVDGDWLVDGFTPVG